jgi:hypothetical protein
LGLEKVRMIERQALANSDAVKLTAVTAAVPPTTISIAGRSKKAAGVPPTTVAMTIRRIPVLSPIRVERSIARISFWLARVLRYACR